MSDEAANYKFPTGLRERFLAKVERQPDGCWLWTAYKNPKGYGLISVNACVRPMVSQKIYDANRGSWRQRGYVRHGAGDLCNGCYARRHRRGEVVPGLVPGRRRPAPGSGPLSEAEVARLRGMVGAA